MSLPHFRAVMLVLASHNNSVYINARRVWKAYANRCPQIKVYMVYGKTVLADFDPVQDLVYEDIEENYCPGMLKKTIRAMEQIQCECTFDFFIRTNISTFWNFDMLLKTLETLPATLCYSGDGPLGSPPHYLSGTDTIVNPYMISLLVENKDSLDYYISEDQAMGKFFHGILGAPMIPSKIHFMENFTTMDGDDVIIKSILTGITEGKDHYRVKNNGTLEERTLIDGNIYKKLLKHIYGIAEGKDNYRAKNNDTIEEQTLINWVIFKELLKEL